MPRLRTPPEKISAAKQLFLSGRTYAQIEAVTGVCKRTLTAYCKAEGWEQDRKSAQSAFQLNMIENAVETRVTTIRERAKADIGSVFATVMSIADKASSSLDALSQGDLQNVDVRDLTIILKAVIDSAGKLQEIQAKGANSGQTLVLNINSATACATCKYKLAGAAGQAE